jgi:hypothetical protein
VRGGTLAKQSNGLALLLAQDTVRMPSNAALVTGYAVACHRDSLRNLCGRKRPRRAPELACGKTLASQASVAQIGPERCYRSATGALEATLVLQELCKDSDFGLEHRHRREQPCQTRTVGKSKTPGIVSSTSSKTASVDAWDDAATPIRHEGATAPGTAPVAGQVF